jgi:hypothetical protein
LEQITIQAEIIAPDDRTDRPQVVCKIIVSEQRVGVSELGNVPEPQQDWKRGVIGRFHENNAVVVGESGQIRIPIPRLI